MKIILSPQLCAAPFVMSAVGDVLTIDGMEYDFGPLAEGDVLPRDAVDCPWLASDVTRENGHVCMTLILPHGTTAPHETRFPEHLTITEDGPVELPPFDTTPAIEEPQA
ncbi:hypothetical protein [Paracoccus sp. SY]|uniref:hypothetical protein n=1 Tax=Paracoccus sp. SY TaxID=1330255 RepID=UPI000CD2E45F|nr:hypothetical protein [Paracoccus sp. SY]